MPRESGATILLLGDDDLLERALERALSAEGLRVRRGELGAAEVAPSMVVFGPCADGPSRAAAQLERLRAESTVPLLVIRSGHVREERLGAWGGPLAYISEPFDGRQFVEAVRAHLAAIGPVG